jgi:hypothetical protein
VAGRQAANYVRDFREDWAQPLSIGAKRSELRVPKGRAESQKRDGSVCQQCLSKWLQARETGALSPFEASAQGLPAAQEQVAAAAAKSGTNRE